MAADAAITEPLKEEARKAAAAEETDRGRFSDLPPNMLKPAANQAFGGK